MTIFFITILNILIYYYANKTIEKETEIKIK